jgi:tetratricopeptide (TPR) repeat protein
MRTRPPSLPLLLLLLCAACSGKGGNEVSRPDRPPVAAAPPPVDEAVDAGELARKARDEVSARADGDASACLALLVADGGAGGGTRAEALLALAAMHLARQEPDEALRALHLLALPGLDDELLSRAGVLHARAGDLDGASRLLDDVPGHADAVRAAMAARLASMGEPMAALSIVDDIADASEHARAVEAVALGQAEDGLHGAALESLALIEDDEPRLRARIRLARLYARSGDLQRAVECVSGAGEHGPLVEVVRAASEAGHAEQAVALTERIASSAGRAEALLAVGLGYGSAGQPAMGRQVLGEALQTAVQAPDPPTALLDDISAAFVELGDLNGAWSAARANPEPALAGTGLARVAVVHAQRADDYMAFKVAEAVADEDARVRAWAEVAGALARAGRAEPALKAAMRAGEDDADVFVDALCAVADPVVAAGRGGLFGKVETAVATSRRDALHGCLALAFARAGHHGRAFDHLEEAADDGVRLELVSVYADAGDAEHAARAAAPLGGEPGAQADAEVVRALVLGGDVDGAMQRADDIGHDRLRAVALLYVAGGRVAGGRHDAAADALVAAGALAGDLCPERFFDPADVWPGRTERALVYAHALAPGGDRAGALLALARLLESRPEEADTEAPELLSRIVAP